MPSSCTNKAPSCTYSIDGAFRCGVQKDAASSTTKPPLSCPLASMPQFPPRVTVPNPEAAFESRWDRPMDLAEFEHSITR